MKTVFAFEQRIKQLENELSMEISLKRSEIMYNKDLKKINDIKDLTLQTMAKVNQEYSEIIVNLRTELKDLTFKN